MLEREMMNLLDVCYDKALQVYYQEKNQLKN